MKRTSLLTAATLTMTMMAAACGGGGSGGHVDMASTADMLAPATYAVVTTSRYNPDFTGVGTLNTVALKDETTKLAIDTTLDPDVEIHTRGQQAMILNRSTGTVRLYDTTTWHVMAEVSTGDSTHPAAAAFPQGLWWTPNSLVAYVSLSGNDAAHAIGVVDLAQPSAGVIRWVALNTVADDTDGAPEAATLYGCNGKVYALLQSYTYDATTFSVTYHAARIAVIDPASDAAAASYITLAGKNPYGISATPAGCDKVLLSTAGNLTTAPDGTSGIEAVDLTAGTTGGFVLKDQDVGGRTTSVISVSATLAFAAEWTDLAPNSMGVIYLSTAKVIAFNPTTKAVIGDVTGKAGNIAFIALSPDNRLFVGTGLYSGMVEAGKLNKGLYIGPADGTALGTTPIDLGDTPSAIAFFETL